MSIESDKVPPVPSTVDISAPDGTTNKLSIPWLQWFQQVKTKIDILNESIVALAGLTGVGYLAKNGTAWAVRTLVGTSGNISISDADGSAGNSVVNLIATGVTAGAYTSLNATIDDMGRITDASNGSADGAVPYFVPAGGTYTVAVNKQALWKLPISLGIGASLNILGALEQVD